MNLDVLAPNTKTTPPRTPRQSAGSRDTGEFGNVLDRALAADVTRRSERARTRPSDHDPSGTPVRTPARRFPRPADDRPPVTADEGGTETTAPAVATQENGPADNEIAPATGSPVAAAAAASMVAPAALAVPAVVIAPAPEATVPAAAGTATAPAAVVAPVVAAPAGATQPAGPGAEGDAGSAGHSAQEQTAAPTTTPDAKAATSTPAGRPAPASAAPTSGAATTTATPATASAAPTGTAAAVVAPTATPAAAVAAAPVAAAPAAPVAPADAAVAAGVPVDVAPAVPLASGAVPPVAVLTTPAVLVVDAPSPIAVPPAPVAHPTPAQQIAPYLVSLGSKLDGTHRMTLQLHPEDLGSVRISVELLGQTVNVSLIGDDNAARDLLKGSLPDLRRELAAAGLDAGTLDVSTRQPGTGLAGHGTGEGTDARRTPDGVRADPSPAREGTFPRTFRRSGNDHSGAIDVTV